MKPGLRIGCVVVAAFAVCALLNTSTGMADEIVTSVGASVINLRCEDLVDPVGIDVVKPRLSWQMRSDRNGAAQTAYQVLCATAPELLTDGTADLWNSGKVAVNQSQGVVYGGKTLTRGNPHYWTVRIWDETGEASAWSKPAFWTRFDMPRDNDWQAKWITDEASSPWFRQTLELDANPARAYIYVNALGYFNLYINGKRVGTDAFTPHVGQYDKRTLCITYDVAEYLQKGKNVVGIWMGSGWNQDGAGVNTTPSVRAQLEVEDTKGEITTLATDETWYAKASSHAYRGQWRWGNFGGEIHNGAKDQPDWADLDFDDSAWPRARVAKLANTQVSAEMLQRNRVIETITPLKVTRRGPTTWLVDMGKAMTGTFEITFPEAEKGHSILMEFGDGYHQGRVNSHGQSSEYIYRGSGVERFENRFNYASCQYIQINNVPDGEFTPEDIKGHFITTDLPAASTFVCSDKTLNAIHKMMEHTLRCLMLGGYQTDCHSRERTGYGGDGYAALDTTLSLLRADAFYRKWTRDWVDQQKPDGNLTYTAPATGHGGGPFWPGFLTAATLKHFHHYGDIDLVERNYPAIRKWFELAQSKTVDGIQQKFTGQKWYLGDWASPKGIADRQNAEIFIQAYMAYELGQAARLADILGKGADADTFREWAAERKAATHKAFYDPKNTKYGSGDQVTYVLPLMAGVVPDPLYDQVFAEFEKTLKEKNKGHLSTGLSGTYMMIQYLQSIGRDDLIYLFASKTTYPSWGHMIKNGATATWEHWGGQRSRIHNCFNSIGSWLIQGLAGIRPDTESPGFQNAIIQPAFVKELDYVKGSHESLYGTIESHWKREGDGIHMRVQIPANTTATVHVPATSASDVTANGNPVETADHVTLLRMDKGTAILRIASGHYTIRSRLP